MTDIINPLLGLLMGSVGGFKEAFINLGSVKILYGDLISVIIDFLIVALVVYFGVKFLGINKLDKKKK